MSYYHHLYSYAQSKVTAETKRLDPLPLAVIFNGVTVEYTSVCNTIEKIMVRVINLNRFYQHIQACIDYQLCSTMSYEEISDRVYENIKTNLQIMTSDLNIDSTDVVYDD